jgi:dimethylaniline monooxygenase (N-oxide forming)
MQTYRITIKLKLKQKKNKRVAIIGSGPAGLVSAKYAVENDIVPVIFDRKNIPGGLWSSGTAIWDDMHTNVSKYSVQFSDLPHTKEVGVIPSARDIYNYLLEYIRVFQLEKYFKLNTNVESVRQLPNKKWQVTWTNYLNGERCTEVFDYLICSTGLHCKPNVPRIKNSEKYGGLLLHSADYRSRDERLKDKRIVVVANSYSGVEISSHLVGHAKHVVNLFSRPYLVFPRLLQIPIDETVVDEKSKRLVTVRRKDKFKIVPIDLFFSRAETFTTYKTKEDERRAKVELYKKLCPDQTNRAKALPQMYYELDNDEPIREAVTDNYYPYIKNGKITPVQGKIAGFERAGLRLEDNRLVEADAVLFCTGYKLCLDYFDQSVLKTLKFDPNKEKMPILMYKYTVHPDLENLAMVGEVNGLFFAGFELQAKWAIQLFKGWFFFPKFKVRGELQNATHSFRSEKFLHHCVQRVSKPRKPYLV